MADTLLNDLSRRRVILVTGKGGTGKSVVSTAIALALSALGKRVLLTEMGRSKDRAFMRLHELIGAKELSHSFRPVVNPINANSDLLASRIDPLESLLEYLSIKLRSSRLPSLLLKNKITGSFLNVIPGLTELVCLGKLWHLGTDDKQKDVETIVLDAPASGHALTLLNSPHNFAELTRIGPVYNDAIKMQEFLKDESRFGVVYCSLPEEMPLQESKEFCERYAKHYTDPFVVVNKIFPKWEQSTPVADDHPCFRLWKYAESRIQRESKAIESYRDEFTDDALSLLPFCFSDTEALSDSPAVQLARKLLVDAKGANNAG